MESKNISVMQFNIFHEGTQRPDGYYQIVNAIAKYSPDFVCFSENRNLKGANFCKMINFTLSLRYNIKYYTHEKSYDTAILCKHNIENYRVIFEYVHSQKNNYNTDRGSIISILTEINGKKYSVYSCHLDWKEYAPYLKNNVNLSSNDLLRKNLLSKRILQTMLILFYSLLDLHHGIIPIIAGDFNEPSHLNWTNRTRNQYSRSGKVVEWQSSSLLQAANFKDAYRYRYQDEQKYPGWTYPVSFSKAHSNVYTARDDRDRLDFIYYLSQLLKLENIKLFGTTKSFAGKERGINKIIISSTNNINEINRNTWVSDHNGLISKFTPIDVNSDMFKEIAQTIYGRIFQYIDEDKSLNYTLLRALRYFKEKDISAYSAFVDIFKLDEKIITEVSKGHTIKIVKRKNVKRKGKPKVMQPFTEGFVKNNPAIIRCGSCTFNNPLQNHIQDPACEICGSKLFSN